MGAVYLILFPAIFSSLLGLTSQDQPDNHHLIIHLREAKLNVAQLESALEEIIQNVKARDLYIEESEKKIEEMEKRINDLQSNLSNLKVDSLLPDEKINVLEEKAHSLWATLRKNNFDLHVLETKAQEAEERLEVVTSQVEKMEDIVTERWIQIQQFEQALQLLEMRLKAQKRVRALRCTFFKALELLDSHLFGTGSALISYVSQILHQSKRYYSTVKEFHHELQCFIKREMERYEFSAYLANEELVFFVASALIIFPVLGAWMLLSSQ